MSSTLKTNFGQYFIDADTVRAARKFIRENRGLTARVIAAKLGMNVNKVHALIEHDTVINGLARKGAVAVPTFTWAHAGRRPNWFKKLPANAQRTLLASSVDNESEQLVDTYLSNLPISDAVLRSEYQSVMSQIAGLLASIPADRAARLAPLAQESVAMVAIEAETNKIVLNSQRTMLAALTSAQTAAPLQLAAPTASTTHVKKQPTKTAKKASSKAKVPQLTAAA